jgi:hypothetical protein
MGKCDVGEGGCTCEDMQIIGQKNEGERESVRENSRRER